MIRLEIVYTKKMLLDFFRFSKFGKAHSFVPWFALTWLCIFILIGLGFILARGTLFISIAFTAIMAGVLLSGILAVSYFLIPARAAKRMLMQTNGRTLICTFDSDRMILQLGSGGKKEKYIYSALYQVCETPLYFFIYKTRLNANIISKETCVDGGTALSSLLQSAVPAGMYRKI